MGSFGASDEAIEVAFQDVVARYGEHQRRYHTFAHVLDVLGTLDELFADPVSPEIATADRRAIRAAGWFHDVVYDPTQPDNEARSAQHARDTLTALGLGTEAVEEVARLIELTAGHEVADGDVNGMLLADADLAILGAAPDRYERYTGEIRAEYAHVPDEQFRRGRALVLESFLQRPRLYLTVAGAERFDELARENLRVELEALRADDETGSTA